jgi:hypothetical protein
VKPEIEAKLEELHRLTSKMDVPVTRRTSVHWLARNLAIRNSGHPNFPRAMELVKELIRIGVH